MSSSYLLCITIPTYNRKKYLHRLLESIVTQEYFSEKISIMINDWPSSDETTEMVLEYQKKHKNIFYVQNEKAVGMLPAILESIDMSNWEYTWLIWSDDYMVPWSLEIVMWIIDQKSSTLILSEREVTYDFNHNKSNKHIIPNILNFQWMSDRSIYLWLHQEEKFEDKFNYFTFMSVFCFKTEYYKNAKNYVVENILSIQELNKHYFNYIVILFSKLYNSEKITIVENYKLIYCQWGNTSRQPNNKINIDLKMLLDLVWSTYSISKNTKKLLKRMYLNSYIFGSIIYKLQKIPLLWRVIVYLSRNKVAQKLYTMWVKKLS